ncbi:hypothetical protein CMK18_16785 [Candidatus Poribacteria bacterium]|nr:hypothetical protein [Candidatus Poribacteria bacterium]
MRIDVLKIAHENCKLSTVPKTNCYFWLDKFESYVERDLNDDHKSEKLVWYLAAEWEFLTKSLSNLLM